MPNEWTVAAVAGVVAVIGGFVGGVTPSLVEWYFRPKLMIDCQDSKDNKDTIVTIENPSSAGQISPDIDKWVRARVQNTGTRRAKQCQVFLTSLHEVHAGASQPAVQPAVLKDSKVLPWTGRGKKPLDVPPGVEFYVDLMKASSKDPGAWGIIGLFKHQQHLQHYDGTYQFCLMISADNASPRTCAINVEYKHDLSTLHAGQVPHP